MRAPAAVTAAALIALSGALVGCTPSAPPAPAAPQDVPSATPPGETATPDATPSPSMGPSESASPTLEPTTAAPGLPSETPAFDPSATPSAPETPAFSATPTAPTASVVPTPGAATPADSLEAAFAQPENGGIAAFLSKHPDYLPATVVIGAEVVSGASTGPVELNLKNLPPTTTRMYMAIACTESKPYKMELTRADGSAVATSWGESCGYWGGLNGYTTTPFDITNPPSRLAITVDPSTKFSYVLYASPGR